MDQVSEVREHTDIVALIAESLTLKKAGRNFKATCPFHNEKSASFVVSPERQIWHCFGCGKGGDCFTFLMEYERLEFPEALRILAQKAGIILEQQSAVQTGVTSKKEKIYVLNALAAEFYHYLLTTHSVGKAALAYVTNERKVLPQTLNTFKIGYAPRNDALVSYLTRKKGYTIDDLYEAGLVTSYQGRVHDFFRDRLLFALYDHRDNIIGFAGRVLNPAMQPKYINTPEKLVYHKGKTFFGLNIAKNAIKKENQVIIMEGEFDVISSFQEGITHAVAVKGTALTEEQVNLIARYASKVTLCFDMDAAGQNAVKRSLPILEKKGLRTTVIMIPEGKDADEAIKHNPIAFKKAVKQDMDIYEFLLQKALNENDKQSAEGKKKISDALLPVFAGIENEIIKEHYFQKLSREIGTSIESIKKEIERNMKKEIVPTEIQFVKTQRSREEILEEYLIALLVQDMNPVRHLDGLRKMITVYKFKIPAFQKILDILFTFTVDQPSFNAKVFAEKLPPELSAAFDTCFLLPLPKFSDEEHYKTEIQKVTEELYGLFVHEQIKIMGSTIKAKEKSGNLEELELLQKELGDLVSLLKKK